MAYERLTSRRRHGEQLKALVLAQCAAPGASVAQVAMSHGLNANVVHRGRQVVRDSGAGGPVLTTTFVPVSLSAPPPSPMREADIRIELRRGATTMRIHWPVQGAGECAAWLREWLK